MLIDIHVIMFFLNLKAPAPEKASHGGGRRPFRCPYCGHTCPSGDFRFCPHFRTPWIADHGCEVEIQLPLRYNRAIHTGENKTRTDCINGTN